jgi:hypothetical protein
MNQAARPPPLADGSKPMYASVEGHEPVMQVMDYGVMAVRPSGTVSINVASNTVALAFCSATSTV